MVLLNKIIESALTNIEHDFYSFHRFDKEIKTSKPEKEEKIKPLHSKDEKVVQLRVINSPIKNNEVAVGTYPKEWQNLYIQNNFSEVDPVVIKLKNSFNPILWGENYYSHEDLDLDTKVEFVKNAQDFKIYQGISVPLGNYLGAQGAMTIAFKKNKFISETSFFCMAAHLRTIGNTIFKLQDFIDDKINIPLEEYEELFKFLKNSNHSCTAAM